MTGQSQLPSPIAIDGPAASGKSTLGQALAESLGYLFLDTGLMYRAFALAALRSGTPASDEAACTTLASKIEMNVEANQATIISLGHEDVTALLRSPEIEANVSAYSAIPGVREAMVRMQRDIARRGHAVLAGRDVGTVVLPDAPIKFFLAASEEARANRRATQAKSWGEDQHADRARRDIAGRDVVDSARAASPLRPAVDAIIIDTTLMDIAAVIAFALERIRCAAS